MLLFEQDGQADAWVNAARIEIGGPGEARTSPFGEAQGLILVADHANDFSIARGQFESFLPGTVCQLYLPQAGSGVAVFRPNHGRVWILASEFLVARQSSGKVVGKQKLASFIMFLFKRD